MNIHSNPERGGDGKQSWPRQAVAISLLCLNFPSLLWNPMLNPVIKLVVASIYQRVSSTTQKATSKTSEVSELAEVSGL